MKYNLQMTATEAREVMAMALAHIRVATANAEPTPNLATLYSIVDRMAAVLREANDNE